MVRGLEVFKEYFSSYTGQYAFIGGTACDIILGNIGIDFRATKDLDLVLLIEALDKNFVEVFIRFIEDGKYQHVKKGTEGNQFYRFEKPINPQFPYMVELFCRKPDFLANFDVRLAPIHISDEVMSLSAILLDDEYYSLLKEGVTYIDNVSVLSLEYLILFKMKAWLDLSIRRSLGEKIDSRDIKKHRNDVFRLAVNIEKETRIFIKDSVKKDAQLFIDYARNEVIDLKAWGIRSISYFELLELICDCYDLK